jgi:hypothetical protein
MITSTRWYWVIGADNTKPDSMVTGREDLRGFAEEDFTRGQYLNGWNEDAWVGPDNVEEDGEPDDVLQNHLGIPIYSPALSAALRDGGVSCVQYCPIRVLHFDGSVVAGFAIANITCNISALDLERSDFDFYPETYFLEQRRGHIRGIRKAVLWREPLTDHHIIRLREFPASIYVSEYFKNIFGAGGFTGCSFREVTVRV